MKRAATLFLFLIATTAIAIAQGQPQGPPKFVPIQAPGAFQTIVYGINNSGVMVGEQDLPLATYGFAIIGDQLLTIQVPNATYTSCQGINAAGVIVGTYQCGVGKCKYPRGFVYQNGKFTDIGLSDGTVKQVFANDINDRGQIVGTFGNQTLHAFLLDGYTFQQLDPPGALSASATAINNSGIIVLNWTDANKHPHASLLNGTKYKNIDVPGATGTYGNKINNYGDVAVTAMDTDHHEFGAVLKNGKYTSFSFPGATGTGALGLNDQDIIVGAAAGEAGQTGFKLIP